MREMYGGAGVPNPVLINQALLQEAQARLAQKQLEAIEKDISIKRAAVAVSSTAVSNQANATRVRILGSFIQNVGLFIKNIARPLGIVAKDLSPYIALAIVIAIVFMGLSPRLNLNLPLNSGAQRVFNSVKTPFQRIRDWFRNFFSFLAPGYRIRRFFALFSFLGGKPKALPRPKMVNGRCDNASWRELGGDGAPGLCGRTTKPKDITWNFDTEKMPDMAKLPEAVYQKYAAGGKKMQVSIPWAVQATFYVPQCSKATFADGSSAAGLFVDDGMACRKREVAAPVYRPKDRPKNAKERDDYADEKNPRC